MTSLATTEAGEALHKPMADVAGRLAYAASPAFALMAWISAVGSPGMTICSIASPLAPINEMTLMYLLMSFFHLPPWLKLVSRRLASPHHAN